MVTSVAYGETCESVSRERTCENGILSGLANFSSTSCSVESAASCELNGINIPDGSSVSAYSTPSVPYGSTCPVETRTCSNGSLDGSFSYSSCAADTGSVCSFNGQTVAHGDSVTAYSSDTAAFGSSCNDISETRSCTNGSLSGSFTFSNCTVDSAAMAGTVTTFGGGGTSRMLGRSTAATGSTSISVNQPVQSLVTLYLLVDEDLKYPVATIKSGTDGSYDVAPSDLQEFLTNPYSDNFSEDYGYLLPDAISGINDNSTDAEIIAAFEALGTLQVRALYVSDGKAKIISAMADPTSDEPAQVNPIVQQAAQQLITAMQETLKETITALEGLSDAAKKEILANAENSIRNSVAEELDEIAEQKDFEVQKEQISLTEALLVVEMDADTTTALQNAIQNNVNLETSQLAVKDKGKLGDTLSDEKKGEYAKKKKLLLVV